IDTALTLDHSTAIDFTFFKQASEHLRPGKTLNLSFHSVDATTHRAFTMDEHPFEQLNHVSQYDDTNSSQTLRKRDKIRQFLGITKPTEYKVKTITLTQSLSADRETDLNPTGSESSKNFGDDQTVVCSASGDKPPHSLSPEDLKPSLPANDDPITSIFSEDVVAPVIRSDLPRLQQRIDKTEQLVYCNTLLYQDSPTRSSTELDWLAEIKKDPMEQDHLHWLVTRMVEVFVEDVVKDSAEIAEVVALGPVLQKEPYRQLLSSIIKEFEEARLLDVNLLQGLVQLVQSSTSGFLVSDDLVKILSILR
ncbi:hypothetical protein BGW39_004086, partial [Mortierella sp. 14UC]